MLVASAGCRGDISYVFVAQENKEDRNVDMEVRIAGKKYQTTVRSTQDAEQLLGTIIKENVDDEVR